MDVLVVGDGIIGLATAVELARRGAKVTVLGKAQQGAATWASGGLLAPSTGPLPDAVRPFFMDSLRAYPAFVARLSAADPGLSVIAGLIELGAAGQRGMDAAELKELEPSLPWRPGILLHAQDGAVDARRLLAALRKTAEATPFVNLEAGAWVTRLELHGARLTIKTSSGSVITAETLILAAGAWSPRVEGLPRPIPVTPLKGQMIALEGAPLTHPVLADHTYLVPRSGLTIVGSTSEETGFDSTTDDGTAATLARLAGEVTPALAGARIVDHWAGLRPMTPDRMPIIGRDPDVPGLIYACGHSRNGILLAPATAESVSDLAMQAVPRHDLEPFHIGRFDGIS